jgi:hypothetical protein
VLVHIGYHKTATSWLQRHLCDNRAAGLAAPWSFEEVIDAIVRPHPLAWDEDAARRLIEGRRRRVEGEGIVAVLSNEELSGNPHAGGHNDSMLAERLATLVPDAQVLIVIRRQPAILVSAYKQYVLRGGTLSPRRYFEPNAAWFRVPAFRPSYYEYDRLIGHYVSLFGRDRVHVFAMEAMEEDRDGFVRGIVALAGGRDPGPLPAAPVGSSVSAATTAVQRRLNRLVLRDDVNPGAPLCLWGTRAWMRRLDRVLRPIAGRAADARLQHYVDAFARSRYAASNRRTAELTSLPLDRLGYEL